MNELIAHFKSLPILKKAVLIFCVFSISLACTIELWWLSNADQLPRLVAHGSLLARGFRLYGQADPSYFHVTALSQFLEGFNVFVTQPLLIYIGMSIWESRPTHKLQLAVGSYLTYSVVFYYAYTVMAYGLPSGLPAILFWGTNAPWLLGGVLLIISGWRE